MTYVFSSIKGTAFRGRALYLADIPASEVFTASRYLIGAALENFSELVEKSGLQGRGYRRPLKISMYLLLFIFLVLFCCPEDGWSIATGPLSSAWCTQPLAVALTMHARNTSAGQRMFLNSFMLFSENRTSDYRQCSARCPHRSVPTSGDREIFHNGASG